LLRKRTFVFKSLPAFAAHIPSICRFQRPLPFNRTRALAELEAKPAEYAQNARVLECPVTSLRCPHPLHASLSESPCITSNESVLLAGINAGIVCPGSESLCSKADQPSVPTSRQCVTSRVHFPKIQTLVSRQQGRQKMPRKRTIEIIFLPAFAAHMQSKCVFSVRFTDLNRTLSSSDATPAQNAQNCKSFCQITSLWCPIPAHASLSSSAFHSSNARVMEKGGETGKRSPGERPLIYESFPSFGAHIQPLQKQGR
jgi:hypothetical protein